MIEDRYSVNELFNQFMHVVLDLLSFINSSLLFICIDFCFGGPIYVRYMNIYKIFLIYFLL
jgi:hypothetical protein